MATPSKSDTFFCWDCHQTLPADQRGPNPYQCMKCRIEVPKQKAKRRKTAIRIDRLYKALRLRTAIEEIVPLAYHRARLAGLSRNLRNQLSRLGDEWLYLWGDTGTGKTFALYALCRNRIASGHSVIFSRWTALADALRDAAKVNKALTQLIEDYGRADIVVVDDLLGGDTETDFVRQRLLEIVDNRMDHSRPIWFTSNRPIEDLKTVFDERLFSRLAGHCKIMKLTGRDRRLNPGAITSPTAAANLEPYPDTGPEDDHKSTAPPGGLFA